jgi:hypothetical protein
VVGRLGWEAVELLVWESRYVRSRIKSAKVPYSKSERHTLCSFCKMFSNTRGHSDLSSWVRKRVNGGTIYATHMSMEPSRAACSRMSSLIDMTVVWYIQYAIGASQVQGGNVDFGNGRMFQTHAGAWLTSGAKTRIPTASFM